MRRWQHCAYGELGSAGLLRYRLKSPRGRGPFPLLIFLYGAGRNGYDGKLPLGHAFLVRMHLALFFRKRLHILVPQLGPEQQYDSDAFSDALGGAVDHLERVDRGRIYIIGISMGGGGVFSECRRRPGRYAAAIPAVGWADPMWVEALARTPMWLTYSREEEPFNAPIYRALKECGADVRYIRLNAFGHKMTGPFFTFWPWAGWLFSHKNNAASEDL